MPVLLSTWAARTVAPSGSSGALPNRYQPATSGLAGRAIRPSVVTPCGSTVMSMPSRETATRVGADGPPCAPGVAGAARSDGRSPAVGEPVAPVTGALGVAEAVVSVA